MASSPPRTFADSLTCHYIASVLSAFNAELATYPFDLVKTRMQIQGELANKELSAPSKNLQYRGLAKTSIGIIREEGPLKLWQGISAAFWRHSFYSGGRIIVYKTIKEELFGHNPSTYFPLWQSVLCGVTAGAAAQYIASPADLLKVQLQMEGKRKLMGLKPRVNGLFDAFTKTVRAGGVRGLWKGSIPNVQRAALVNLGDLTAYDVAKGFVLRNTSLEDGHFVRFIASICAGFVAAGLGTPADVIKTRVMNQAIDDRGRALVYSSSIDCLQKTVRNEGFMALYKGFIPIWLRLGPWAMVFWMSYEEVLSLMGAQQF